MISKDSCITGLTGNKSAFGWYIPKAVNTKQPFATIFSIFTSVIYSECCVVMVDSNKISGIREVGTLPMAINLTNGHQDVY